VTVFGRSQSRLNPDMLFAASTFFTLLMNVARVVGLLVMEFHTRSTASAADSPEFLTASYISR
jgi:hypothetical protein